MKVTLPGYNLSSSNILNLNYSIMGIFDPVVDYPLLVYLIGVVALPTAGILFIIYLFLVRTTNRIIQIGVPALVILAGFLLWADTSTSFFIFVSIYFVVPATVIIPAFVFPGLVNQKTRFTRILACDLLLSTFWVILVVFFVEPHDLWFPGHSGLSPLYNEIIVVFLIAMDLLFAFGVLRALKHGETVAAKIQEA